MVAEASSESEAKASDSDENGGVFVIPSLREVLLVNSPHFLQFLEFAKKCMCSEALLFWKVGKIFRLVWCCIDLGLV